MFPEVPDNTDPELVHSISALTHAAHSYRSVLFLVAEGMGGDAIKRMLVHEDILNLSDAVINAWRHKLGHDVADMTESG